MNDLKQIEKKLKELDELKKKVEKLYSLNEIGDEIKEELELERYKKLKENNIDIPHLDKTIGKKAFSINKKSQKIPPTKEQILEAQSACKSAMQTARRLGISYPSYKKHATRYGIFKTPCWPIKRKDPSEKRTHRGGIDPNKGRYPIAEIIAGKYPDFPTHRLKDKLIRSGIKKAECENCGYKERRFTDGKLPLLLNYEDGDNTNHRIENLKIFCYNCTFTCGKGYISRSPKNFKLNINSFDPDVLQESKKEQLVRF